MPLHAFGGESDCWAGAGRAGNARWRTIDEQDGVRRKAKGGIGPAIAVALFVSLHVVDLAMAADAQIEPNVEIVSGLTGGQADQDRLLASLKIAMRQQAAETIRMTVRATGARREGGDARNDASWRPGPWFDLVAAGLADEAASNVGVSAPAPAAQRPAPDQGSALSARERDVLRLIVDDRSDREIAAELSLCSTTVTTYVTNLLTKLDLPSRTAAADAVRHGLA